MKKRFAFVLVMIMISVFLIQCGGSGGPGPVMPAYNGTSFYGDLVTEGCAAFINGTNRAFTNDTSGDMLTVIDDHFADDEGKRYHILIGVNDVVVLQKSIYNGNMIQAMSKLNGRAVMITSILPTYHAGLNADILDLNGQLKMIAYRRYNVEYRDMHNLFADPSGRLKAEYSLDGIRLTDRGCQLLFDGIE